MRKIFLGLMLLAVFISAVTVYAEPKYKIKYDYNEFMEQYSGTITDLEEIASLEKDVLKFTENIKEKPNSSTWYLYRGNRYLELFEKGVTVLEGKVTLDSAISDFDAAIERDKNNAYAYVARGAARDLKAKILFYLNDSASQRKVNLASCEIQIEDACADIIKGAKLDGAEADGCFYAGIATQDRALFKIAQGKLSSKAMEYIIKEDAIPVFGMAIKLEPRESKYYFERAKACVKIGMLEQAVIDYDAALKYAFDDIEELKIYQERIKIYGPMWLSTPYRYANVNSDYKKVLEILESYRTKELDEESAANLKNWLLDTYKTVTKLNTKQKDYNAAIENYTNALKIQPDANFYFNRGEIYEKNLKNYEAALADYNSALEIEGIDDKLAKKITKQRDGVQKKLAKSAKK